MSSQPCWVRCGRDTSGLSLKVLLSAFVTSRSIGACTSSGLSSVTQLPVTHRCSFSQHHGTFKPWSSPRPEKQGSQSDNECQVSFHSGFEYILINLTTTTFTLQTTAPLFFHFSFEYFIFDLRVVSLTVCIYVEGVPCACSGGHVIVQCCGFVSHTSFLNFW